SDAIRLMASPAPRRIDGGGPETTPGDTLIIDALGHSVTLAPTAIVIDGFAPVTYTGQISIQIVHPGPSVPAEIDLAIAQSQRFATITAGQHQTYPVSVTNLGSSTATGVVLTDHLPDGADLVSVNSPAGVFV